MPSAEIFLAYHNTPPAKRLKFNPFSRPTVFSFVDPKGKLVITSPFDYEAAKHDFHRRLEAEFDFILVAEKIVAKYYWKTPKGFLFLRKILCKSPVFQEDETSLQIALAWDIPLSDLLKHEKILDIAVRKKYGLRIAIFLRIFLYCKLISRAKIYGTK